MLHSANIRFNRKGDELNGGFTIPADGLERWLLRLDIITIPALTGVSARLRDSHSRSGRKEKYSVAWKLQNMQTTKE